MRIDRYGFILTTLAAALCGCAVGPDFQRPATPAPQGYTRALPAPTASAAVAGGDVQHFSSNTTLSDHWWQAFGSPAINDLVQRAFAHNPTVDSARAALRQAHENTAAQFGASFPQVQAAYSASRQGNAVGTLSPTLADNTPVYTLHTAQLSVSYAPDVFGLNRRTVESLTAAEAAQQFQLQATYTTLASNVVAAAIQLAALQAQIAATEATLVANQHALDILHQQARAGMASALDVAAQQTALAQAQQTLPPLQKQQEQTRDLLAVLVGDTPDQNVLTTLDLDSLHLPQDLPLTLPSDLVKQRPDVRAAEENVHAASAEVGIALANRLPQFSISALYGGTATQFGRMFDAGNRFWGLTGNVAATVFDFGSLKHHQNAAQAALDEATADYRSVVLGAFQNVADSLYALNADARGLNASALAEQASQHSLELTQSQLKLGGVNVLALLSAEQAYQQAKISRIQMQAARFTDTVVLYQALGGGWNEERKTASAQ